MNNNNRLMMAVLGAGALIVLALGLVIAMLFDADGWGLVATELTLSGFIQVLAGGLLLALPLTVLYGLSKPLFTTFTRRLVLTGLFISTMLMSLSLLPFVLERPVYLYDLILTGVLGLAFFLTSDALKSVVVWFADQVSPKRAGTPRVEYEYYDDSSGYEVAYDEGLRGSPGGGFSQPAVQGAGAPVRYNPQMESFLYEDLLDLVNGNQQVLEELVEYERGYAPYANREELLRRAIERYESNNHQP